MSDNLPSYVVVTPVRDEARHIFRTIASMRDQTRLPVRWIIVDDGSTDETPDLITEGTRGLSWVQLIGTGNVRRALGSAEVIAFQHGMAALEPGLAYDYVVKLDGDVELPPDYFERVLSRMETSENWGIASGVYCEEVSRLWQPVAMPPYHAAGASKVLRRACYEAIDGFVARKGWDTVDEIRAGLKGWRTGHFKDIHFRHLKPEGAAMGTLSTHRFHGEIYYQTGGGPLFLLAKTAYRMLTRRPRVVGGLMMAWGYIVAFLSGAERLVTADEARYYRRLLNARLFSPATRLRATVARHLV